MKRCTKCGQDKELSAFSRYSKSKDGLQYACRPCHSAAANAWNKANRERRRAIDRARHARHREKRNAASRAYHEANRDQLNAKGREYGRKRYAKDPAKCYERTQRWAAKNPELTKAKRDRANAARRAVVARAMGSHTHEERRSLYASYSRLCVYCNEPARATHLDHMTPLVRGGCNHITNLAPACGRCNQSKGKLTLLEFLVKRGKGQWLNKPP